MTTSLQNHISEESNQNLHAQLGKIIKMKESKLEFPNPGRSHIYALEYGLYGPLERPAPTIAVLSSTPILRDLPAFISQTLACASSFIVILSQPQQRQASRGPKRSSMQHPHFSPPPTRQSSKSSVDSSAASSSAAGPGQADSQDKLRNGGGDERDFVLTMLKQRVRETLMRQQEALCRQQEAITVTKFFLQRQKSPLPRQQEASRPPQDQREQGEKRKRGDSQA